jgi:hypothetical protein
VKKRLFGSLLGFSFTSHKSRFSLLAMALVSAALALLLCVAATGGQLPGRLGDLGKFNPIAPKEPVVADTNRAFPRVPTLPGPSFAPVSYGTDPLIAQLAQSSSGIVRLPPGDYSIPVRFY